MRRITAFFLFITVIATAQTRLISHKSHSGSLATFNTALKNNLFDIGASNFGLPNMEMRYTIDSIVLQPDNSAIIISSEKDVFVHLPVSTVKFHPGRDTVYSHPLLSQRHLKDSIAKELNKQNENPVLINYDNKTKEQEKNTIMPPMPSDDNGMPSKPLIIISLALVCALFGLVLFLINRLKALKLSA